MPRRRTEGVTQSFNHTMERQNRGNNENRENRERTEREREKREKRLTDGRTDSQRHRQIQLTAQNGYARATTDVEITNNKDTFHITHNRREREGRGGFERSSNTTENEETSI